jgi:hypothetical protein
VLRLYQLVTDRWLLVPGKNLPHPKYQKIPYLIYSYLTHLDRRILGLKILSCLGAIAIWWWGCQGAIAERLSDAYLAEVKATPTTTLSTSAPTARLRHRIERYPDWHQPQFKQHQGELTYPEWFEGRWVATSTLLEQIAPLAPALMTPGFDGNRKYIERPIEFTVQFIPNDANLVPKVSLFSLPQLKTRTSKPQIVADRSFNGFNIAAAYLGAANVKSVKVDPHNPTKQITQLTQDRQLVSFVTGFDRELPNPNHFLGAEISQQVFRGNTTIYLNTVETITSYHFSPLPTPKITATQISAIYLSPQDPDYFRARDLPVALYKYKLDLVRDRKIEI